MTENETEKLLTPAVETAGFEITDIKISYLKGKPALQIFIDKMNSVNNNANGGITLDDCELVSNAIGNILDNNDYFKDGYSLEISSPGVDRVIKKPKDFNRFAGMPLKIKLRQPLEGTRIFYGNIIKCEDSVLNLTGDLKFKLDDIAEARLHLSDEDILRKK